MQQGLQIAWNVTLCYLVDITMFWRNELRLSSGWKSKLEHRKSGTDIQDLEQHHKWALRKPAFFIVQLTIAACG
jgi:hypothetical protein